MKPESLRRINRTLSWCIATGCIGLCIEEVRLTWSLWPHGERSIFSFPAWDVAFTLVFGTIGASGFLGARGDKEQLIDAAKRKSQPRGAWKLWVFLAASLVIAAQIVSRLFRVSFYLG